MSTELGSTRCLSGDVSMTRYYGGAEQGTCVSLVFKKPEEERGKLDYGYWYMRMTPTQAREMAVALLDFADGAVS